MAQPKTLTTPKAPFARSAYNYDTNVASRTSGLRCDEPTLTQQHFKDETDINVLLQRFNITGQLPQGVRMPTYGDFSQVYDYHSAANAIAVAKESFDQMPADLRARFGNNPAKFVEFCSDDKNREEAVKMGLVPPPKTASAASETPIPDTETTTQNKTASGGSTPLKPGLVKETPPPTSGNGVT